MAELTESPDPLFSDYTVRLQQALAICDWESVHALAQQLLQCWRENRQLFICGNGGSAGNALHLANDFLYGIDQPRGQGLRVTALTANVSVLTCLANDVGYEQVFSFQLKVLAQQGDLLLVLSGSGNSPNVVEALQTGRQLGLRTAAILGYSGGRCKELADIPIHFPIDDMQIAEDLQLIIGHILMQWLRDHRPTAK